MTIYLYTWDLVDRLVDVRTRTDVGLPTDLLVKVAFEYDSQDRRISKKVYRWDTGQGDWNATPETYIKFVWSGWLLIAELDGNDSNALLRSYTWGQNMGGGVGGLLSVTDHTRSKTYHAARDGNGNVTALVDATGETVAAYEYAPNGQPTNIDALDEAAADVSRFLFSTKYYDAGNTSPICNGFGRQWWELAGFEVGSQCVGDGVGGVVAA